MKTGYRCAGRACFLAMACGLAMWGGVAAGQVQHGSILVVENDGENTPASVSLTRVGGYGAWSIVSGSSNRGDYVVDFATGNDVALGVPIFTVYEAGRSEPSVDQDPYYATASAARGTGNWYFCATNESPTGDEVNYNPALAFFPIGDGWLTGAAYNSTNNGPLTEFVGNPAIELRDDSTFTGTGLELTDHTYSTGWYSLTFEGYDLRRDGVLLACAASNEDNRAAVNIGADGTATLCVIDNGVETGGENDPVAFAFIPAGTPGVVMGRITASGRKLFAQGDFSVQMVGQPGGDGVFRITIPGQSHMSGTLLAVAHSELGGPSEDNIIVVAKELPSWRIETYDIEPLPAGLSLEDLPAGDVAFHFVFFPNNTEIYPVEPVRDYEERLNDIVAARFSVAEYTPGNTLGEMRAERVAGSDALDVFADNRGDVGISYLSARPAAYLNNGEDAAEGVFIGSPMQLYRDNSATGGVSGWSTFSFDDGLARTHQASTGDEINSDFAVALFPAGLGLLQGADVPASGGQAVVRVSGEAASDGVLMAVNWDNNNRIVSAQPDGSAFDLTVYEADSGAVATSSAEYGYVYLPYSLPGLVAGRVDAAGNVLSGVGRFTIGSGVSSDGYDVTTITIPGIDADADGILLLTATDGPYAMAWEPAADGSFHVAGFDCQSQTVGRVGFMFAYVAYENRCATCFGDLDDDCLINIADAEVLFAGMELAEAAYDDGDLTADGEVDMADFAVLQQVAGADCGSAAGPDDPVLVAPPNGGTVSGSPVTLSVQVTNDGSGPMTVSYYGRQLNTADPFTMVMLPDTQNYSESYPDTFDAQTQWIVDNQEALNIVYVAHLGDIVQRADRLWEWVVANDAISIMDSIPSLPYGLTVGNHDEEPCCGGNPDGTQNFNLFFPYTRYEGVSPWYGGHYGSDNDNSYILFSAGGMDFIAIHFEFDTAANPAVLAWADQLLTTYSDRRAIVVTHYMVSAGNPAPFGDQGRMIYEALKHHANLFLMTGGHVSGEGQRTDVFDGHTIYSILTDYQSRDNGGDGWLRYYEFHPADNLIVARTYSPTLGQYELDGDSQFVLPYDMSGTEFELIGVVSDVDSGDVADLDWTGLGTGRYEWYVTVQDHNGQTTGATWRFNVE